MSVLFVMAGGGTGGHVIPALAVAKQLQGRGHEVVFVGTERGVEGRLVPDAGFRLETIRVGGLANLGLKTRIASAWRLLAETVNVFLRMGQWKPAAVFSMGGYVAGPTVLSALLRKIPLVVMEPNAVPGFTNRAIARRVTRALIAFEETSRFFPPGRTEVTGLPVRAEFFHLPLPLPSNHLRVLITGGSQGSRTLNEAARAAWPMIHDANLPVHFIHQTGTSMYDSVSAEFSATGLAGEVVSFIPDMAAAFSQVDLVVCRSGAGAIAELAAACKPAILVPFPFAADDHQLKNARVFEKAGAAKLVPDAEWTGLRFFELLKAFSDDRTDLVRMAAAAGSLARPGAAERAADILAALAIDTGLATRNNIR